MVESNAIRELVGALSPDDEKKKSDTYSAVVSHIDEEGTVWVILAGSDKETPTASTSTEVKRGDAVTVSWRDNKLYIGGNYSNPSAGVGTVMPSVDFVTELIDKEITVNSINAATGYIKDLTAEHITADDIQASSGYIKELRADGITAEDITADHATIESLDTSYAHITNGVIDNAKIGYADVNGLNANYAQINAANVTDLSAQNAWVNKIMVQTGLIAHEGTVFTLDAIQVNAANITAGTLDVNRLIVTVGGQKYLVNVNPSTGTPTYEKLDGNIVEPRTITADKIVAHDITVQEITTENLVGTNGWINLNLGRFFYGNGANYASSTNAIDWNGTTLKIKGDIGDSVVFNNYSTTTQMNTAIGNAVDGIEVGGRNLILKTDYSKYNNYNERSGSVVEFFNDRVTVSYASEVYQYPYTDQMFDRVIPAGTVITCSVDVYEQTITDGNHRIYVSAINSGGAPRWDNMKVIEPSFTGRLIWSYTTAIDTYGFELDFDTRNSTSGQMTLGRVKAEIGNKATDWTPAPEDVQAEIDAKKNVHMLATSNNTTTGYFESDYSNWLRWAVEGTSTWWDVTSTSGIKVGDTVRLAGAVSNMNNAIIYLTGTVTAINSATRLSLSSHGLDTTIIDGGNILTNSIGANQIAANAISASELDTDNINNSGLLTTGALTVGARNDVLNSNIQIGGVNLIPLSRNLKSFSNESTNFVALTYTNVDCYMEVTTSTTYKYGIYYDVNVSANTTYTLSHRASSVTGTISLGVGNRTGSASAWDDIVPYKNLVNGGNVTTFTTPSGVTKIRIYFGGTNGAHCYIWKLKLELGNKASDWTAAPEDTASVKYLTSEYSQPYPTYVRWVSDYASDTYNVTSSSGVNVGDIVLIEVACTTTNKNLYIQGRVTAIPSDTRVTIAPMGLVDKADYASKNATSYITDINNTGIYISPANQSPTSSATGNSVKIDGNGMEVYKGGASVAFYGDTARVGKEASGNNNILINSGGINFRNSTATFGQISASSYTDVVGSDTKFIEMSAKASDNVYANIDISSSTNALSVLSDSTISLNAQKGTAAAGLSVVATNSPFIDGCVTAKGEYVKLEVGARNGLDNSIKATKISDNTTLAELMTSTGNLTIKGTLTQGSDRRLKDHKKYLGDEANDFIKKLKPAYYIKDAQPHVGFYAQDVESIDKWNCMTGEINGFKTLGYTEIIAPLVAYCQHLEKRIEELERSK